MGVKAKRRVVHFSSWKIYGCVWLAALICCGAAKGGKKKKPTAEELARELDRAPASARDWRNPYEGNAGAVLAGRKLFDRHCANCHGADARGSEKAPDLHVSVVQSAPPGVLFWFLKNGNLKEGMPSWSRLPDPQLWQLVAYLKTLGSEGGATEPDRGNHPTAREKPPESP